METKKSEKKRLEGSGRKTAHCDMEENLENKVESLAKMFCQGLLKLTACGRPLNFTRVILQLEELAGRIPYEKPLFHTKWDTIIQKLPVISLLKKQASLLYEGTRHSSFKRFLSHQ